MDGRVVKVVPVVPGQDRYPLDLSDLDKGLYIVHWKEKGHIRGVAKLIKVR
jgi:hypothetical protein